MLLFQHTAGDRMQPEHTHLFNHREKRICAWRPSPIEGIEAAFEEVIKRCECGEEKAIRTSYTGEWFRSSASDISKAALYPIDQLAVLREVLKGWNLDSDLVIKVSSLMRRTGLRWSDLKEMIILFVRDGIAELYTPYSKRDPEHHKLIFSVDTLSSLCTLLGQDSSERVYKAIDDFISAWDGISPSTRSAAVKVFDILNGIASTWKESHKCHYMDAEGQLQRTRTPDKYLLMLRALLEIYGIACEGGLVPFRELAVTVTGNSKGLDDIKPQLKAILGGLDHYGILEHANLIYCRIPALGEIRGKLLDLSACSDFVTLTYATAEAFNPTKLDMTHLILVENQTPFESLCREMEMLGIENVGIVFLSGNPSNQVRHLVEKMMDKADFGGLVWCDLDPYGVEIAKNVMEWFPKGKCVPVCMDTSYWQGSTLKNLHSTDLERAKALKTRINDVSLVSVIDRMIETGTWIEQEAQKMTFNDIINYHFRR